MRGGLELATDEELCDVEVERGRDRKLALLAVATLALEADELAGRRQARLDALVVRAHEDRAATHRPEVDGLDAVALLAFCADLRPGNIRERECVEECEPVRAVLESELGGDVETADCRARLVYPEAEALTRSAGAVTQGRDRNQGVIVRAVDDRRETSLGVQGAVTQRRDADAVLLAVELTTQPFLMRAGSRETCVTMNVTAEPKAHRVHTGAVPGFWK